MPAGRGLAGQVGVLGMERARSETGRFVKVERPAELDGEREPVEDEGGRGAGAPGRAPRPGNCRVYTRARFAEALPGLMQTLIREAKKGSVAHLKLLVVICGLDQGPVKPEVQKRRVKDLEQILMEDWKREEEREKAMARERTLWDGEDGEAED